jgi:hypothetical protein
MNYGSEGKEKKEDEEDCNKCHTERCMVRVAGVVVVVVV